MKNLLIVLLSFASFQLMAQHNALFDDFSIVGAFGGPIIEIGSINGEVGADVGGGGAVLFDNVFLGGYGMGTDFAQAEILDGGEADRYDIKFSHGGLWLGYTQAPQKLVHLNTSVKIGWGRSRLRQDGDSRYTDQIFVMIPEVGVEVNLTSFFKMNLAAGYRWVNGINSLPGLDNGDFSSPVGILTFRFGGFDF